MNNRLLPLICALLYFLYNLFFTDTLLITSVGISFTVFLFVDFVNKLGHTIPVKELILLIASMQWIVGASISYDISVQHYRYYMYVNEKTYMSYVVPSVFFLWLGLSVIKSNYSKVKLKELFNNEGEAMKRQAFLLIFIGVLSRLLSSFLNVDSLNFIFYLFNIVLFIGVVYLFFCYPKRKWILFLLTVGYLFVLSANSGLFHDFLLTTVFLSFFLISERLKFVWKVSLLVVSFLFSFVIQTVKSDLRDEVWENSENVSGINLFWELAEQQFLQEPTNETIYSGNQEDLEQVNDANSRLNQGWIISKIMDNVPKNKEHLKGETVTDALVASFLPRFLFPNKKGAIAGIENFQDITGLKLQRGTSMGLSVTGEFYANYGVYGGWLAIFIYGIFISLFINWFVKYAGNSSPITYVWLILLFYQVVKAETELIKIVNHLFKSLIVFYVIKIVANSLIINFLMLNSKEEVSETNL